MLEDREYTKDDARAIINEFLGRHQPDWKLAKENQQLIRKVRRKTIWKRWVIEIRQFFAGYLIASSALGFVFWIFGFFTYAGLYSTRRVVFSDLPAWLAMWLSGFIVVGIYFVLALTFMGIESFFKRERGIRFIPPWSDAELQRRIDEQDERKTERNNTKELLEEIVRICRKISQKNRRDVVQELRPKIEELKFRIRDFSNLTELNRRISNIEFWIARIWKKKGKEKGKASFSEKVIEEIYQLKQNLKSDDQF